MAIKSKINYNNSNVLGTNIFSKEEISAPIDNIPVQSVISYLETTNITPRDYYKGTSFRYSGGWLTGTHYLNDQYFVDFVVINNVLLRCKKSHLSSLESKPVRFIYDDKGNIVGIDSEYWDFVLSGFNVGEGSNFQRYYEGNTSDITNPGEGDICTVPNSNTSYIYYKGEWHPWLYISLDNITNWNNKADKVHSAVAGHIATLDSSGNLVDSGKGISDINPLWGNIQGSIANQTDLMSALGDKYEKPSTGIPASDLAAGVIPDVSDFITKNVNDLTYYYTKTEVDGKIASTYKPAGSVANVGSLGSLTAANLGKVYNFTASFTTTSDFVEGSGKTYPVGTNVVIVDVGTAQNPSYKYDVLAGFVDLRNYVQTYYLDRVLTDRLNNVQTLSTGTSLPTSTANGNTEGDLFILYEQSSVAANADYTTVDDDTVQLDVPNWAKAIICKKPQSGETSDYYFRYLNVPFLYFPYNGFYGFWRFATLPQNCSSFTIQNDFGGEVDLSDFTVTFIGDYTLYQYTNGSWVKCITEAERTAWNTKYNKPSSGIPKSDLANDAVPIETIKVNGTTQEVVNKGVNITVPKVTANTEDYWSNHGTYVPEMGEIVVYLYDNNASPQIQNNIKIGNGTSQIRWIPFCCPVIDTDLGDPVGWYNFQNKTYRLGSYGFGLEEDYDENTPEDEVAFLNAIGITEYGSYEINGTLCTVGSYIYGIVQFVNIDWGDSPVISGTYIRYGSWAPDRPVPCIWTAPKLIYEIPLTGIPKTDLASAVQTSLGKADTAYQKPQGGIPESDLNAGVVGGLRETVQFNTLPSVDITSVEDLEDYGFSRHKLISLADGTASALIFNELAEYGMSLSDYRQTECTITKCTAKIGDVSDQCELSFILNGYEYAITADYNTGVATVTVTAVQDITNKADKVSGATNGHLAALDGNGNLTDSGKSISDFATAAQGTKADTAYQKPVGGIPKADLVQAIQDSLGKADGALQGIIYDENSYSGINISLARYIATEYRTPGIYFYDFQGEHLSDDDDAGKYDNYVFSFVFDDGTGDIIGKPLVFVSNYALTNFYAYRLEKTGSGNNTKYSLIRYADEDWVNAQGFLKSFTETDPTVPSWAKASSKPSYDYSEISNTPTIPDAVEANPTVPSGTTPETMETIKIGSQYYELGGGTLDAEDYTGTAPLIVNPSNYYTKTETEALVETPVASTQPSGGFLPNIIYDLGEINGSVTFALATPTDNTIANTYVWTFETGSTAPTIVWPANLTWLGGDAPTINTDKHYEITVRKGYANCLEF